MNSSELLEWLARARENLPSHPALLSDDSSADLSFLSAASEPQPPGANQ